jgi:uncharacterized protein (DUF1697 family)
MPVLKAMCEAAGFDHVRTYIASGNVVFTSDRTEAEVRAALEAPLAVHAGKPVGVLVRSAAALARVRDANPFADRPGNRVVALFADAPLGPATLAEARHVRGEVLRLGERVIYVDYQEGMADSRLVIPAARDGTARNMNTVAKLAELAAALG